MHPQPLIGLFALAGLAIAAEVKPFKWSGEINVPDPVACTVDEAGNVYVTSTSRRKAGDIDIREHRDWIPYDVALTSADAKLAFLKTQLTPGKVRTAGGGIKDFNGDGVIDWQDLAFNKERVYKLTDSRGTGSADKVTVFAEGMNLPNSGIAAGILYFDGWIYVTAMPNLYRFKDTDGDGVADVTEVLATGFGCHLAYAGHDMHGLRLGPDGRIYWTIGDKGFDVLSKEGRRFSFPHTGAVLRCEPDGANFEVFASGIRNLQELAFDDFGDIIGVDNDADQPKERERLVYLLEGSDSGWRCQHQYMALASRWMRENIWMPAAQPDQPLAFTSPIANYSDGPCGFLHEPGHALDGTLRNHFLLNQFPKGKMDAFTLEPDQDGFRMTNLRTINSGQMFIGMSWGTDGRAYFVDWMGGYPLKQKGAVWRMDIAPTVEGSSESFLAKPYSQPVPADDLIALLGHRDQRVRINASIRLDRLGAWDRMLAVATNQASSRLAKIHGIWGYGMGLRHGKVPDPTAALGLLDDPDMEIRVQTMKVLAEAKPSDAIIKKVVEQLAQADLRVRTQAGITLGRLSGTASFSSFLHDAEADLRMPWLRHGLVTGLAGTQTSESLLAVAERTKDAQAVFATLALARQKSPLLSRLLGHADPRVVAEAARAIHDDEGIPSAQASLALALGNPSMTIPANRRALNANLRQGDDAALVRIMDWTLRQPAGSPLREDALQSLLCFDHPPTLDLVDGTAKQYAPRDVPTIAARLRSRQDEFLAMSLASERALALEIMVKYGIDLPFPVLVSLAEDLKAAPAVRLQTLRLLGRKNDDPATIVRTLRSASGEGNPSEVRIEAVGQLFAHDVGAAMEVTRSILDSKSAKLPEKQAVVAALRGRSDSLSTKLRQELVARLVARKLDPGLKLDVFTLARESSSAETAESLRTYLSAGTKGGLRMAGPDLPYELLTDGGDPAKGKAIINGHLGANCTACHRVDSDEGSEVGPILRYVGGLRKREELAESLVEPSAKIVPGFGLETILMKDGSTLSGNVTKETAKSIEIKLPDGKIQKILPSSVASRTPPVSIMPPMLGILTPAEIRDVVAYLSGLKPKSTKPKTDKAKK